MTETAEFNAYLVAGVKAHALKNYESDGWDIVVECWSDDEILEVVEGANSVTAAIKRMKKEVSPVDEQRRAVRNEIF